MRPRRTLSARPRRWAAERGGCSRDWGRIGARGFWPLIWPWPSRTSSSRRLRHTEPRRCHDDDCEPDSRGRTCRCLQVRDMVALVRDLDTHPRASPAGLTSSGHPPGTESASDGWHRRPHLQAGSADRISRTRLLACRPRESRAVYVGRLKLSPLTRQDQSGLVLESTGGRSRPGDGGEQIIT